VPVTVAAVGTGAVEDRVVATGTLRARESISLRSETGGQLEIARGPSGQRLVEGDRVRKGQTVAAILGEEVRLAARTEATRQRYESAERDYESKRALYEEGLLSAEALRPIETTLAEAKLEWERSRLTEARSQLVTPIDGVVLYLARDERGLPLADGQLVTVGFVVAQVAPTDRLVADIDLVAGDVARVRVGMAARVRHPDTATEGVVGRVSRLAPTVDATTRTMRAEVAVDNPAGVLRPGMFVEVTVIAERREGVPVVPREAVAERGGRKVVFVLNGQKVSRREVGLGLGDDQMIEIRQGVQPGEKIVVRGLETLSDGTSVRVSGA
jgi:RND family efflux transporter MFP subunit